MDIKAESMFGESFFACEEMPATLLDSEYPHINTEPLLSDDIWKKFEFDFSDFSVDEMFKELEEHHLNDHTLSSLLGDVCEIRNHDCMWAGHCASKEHPADEPRHQQFNLIPSPPTPAVIKAPAAPVARPPPPPAKPATAVQGGQSLLKNAYRVTCPRTVVPPTTTTTPPTYVHSPQTPPMSDDEEGKSKGPDLIKILEETIQNSDIMDVVDVDDAEIMRTFFEEDDEEDEDEEEEDEEEVEAVRPPEPKYTVPTYAADHSYHKGKNSYVLDTPSDSEEEEIDVVSVEKSFSRMASSLPTNPSTRDRQQLQRRMATAITRKRMSSNLKTIIPLKKPAMSAETIKRRAPEQARGVKRSKQYHRLAPTAHPYKKRHVYGNSSDSEPEPSEKRNLHNNMERQRRIDLRNAFEDLRLLVPEVSKKERAAKVVILREAAQYCDHLGNVSRSYTKQSEDLRRQQEWLRQRVSQLRRNLASKR